MYRIPPLFSAGFIPPSSELSDSRRPVAPVDPRADQTDRAGLELTDTVQEWNTDNLRPISIPVVSLDFRLGRQCLSPIAEYWLLLCDVVRKTKRLTLPLSAQQTSTL